VTGPLSRRPGAWPRRVTGPDTHTAAAIVPSGRSTGALTLATPGSRSATDADQPRARMAVSSDSGTESNRARPDSEPVIDVAARTLSADTDVTEPFDFGDRRRISRIPRIDPWWYAYRVSGTYNVVMGDRGRLVIPAALRERAGLAEGMPLIMLETPTGLVLLTRSQLHDLVRADLAGLDLVGELLAERRAEAAAEDAA
jgi:bifunctional DNA-binding transcriptional regulator/antitoxin component of YhaV-PrlF toxin-antitoxin module